METIYSFGYWVRRRRKALDLTQRELAARVSCALITLKKIEADERRPSVQMAERLAGALQISAAEHDLFIQVARGLQPVDTLEPPPQPTFHRSRDILPQPATPLVGREAELQTVTALLDRPDARLISIVGPGGMGKTRLALAVGHQLSQREPHPFPQGITFIDLAAVTTTLDMVMTIATALGFEPDNNRQDAAAAVRQLAEYLRPRQCLLILDNTEQIDGAPTAVRSWLDHTSAARFLVTSRERLSLAGEHLVSLSGLPYPVNDSPDPDGYPAGRLFLARARRMRPNFVARKEEWNALADVCRMVDGMPLALELAASWVDTITTGEIAMELQRDLGLLSSDMADLPARHRSLSTVLSGTWTRLDPDTRQVFAQLSIFQGGFTRAAVEAVAGASLAMLGRLAGRALITLDRENGRYRIHELLRQYGLEQLGASAEAAAVRQRHFDYYDRLLIDELPRLRGPEQLATLERLDCEQDNIRLALRWGLKTPDDADRVARMIYHLNWYWRMRSRVREGQEWVDRALRQSGRSATAEATLLFVAGHMAWMAGDFETARQRQQASLALLQGDNDPEMTAYTTMALGMTMLHLDRIEEALAWERQSLAAFQALGDAWGTAFIMGQMGQVYQRLGDPTTAEEVMAEALERGHQLGDPFLLAIFYSNASFIAQAEGDLDRATELARTAGDYQRSTGHVHSLGLTLTMLGRFAQQQGDEATARAYWEEALEIFTDIGNGRFAAEAEQLLAGS